MCHPQWFPMISASTCFSKHLNNATMQLLLRYHILLQLSVPYDWWATNAVFSNLITRSNGALPQHHHNEACWACRGENLRRNSIQPAVSFYHNNDKKCWTSILFGITCRKQINRAQASKEETFPCKNQHRASLVPADVKRMLLTGNFQEFTHMYFPKCRETTCSVAPSLCCSAALTIYLVFCQANFGGFS